MRRVAHGIAADARKGQDVGRKTSALFLALSDADAAQAALEFIKGIGEKSPRRRLSIILNGWTLSLRPSPTSPFRRPAGRVGQLD